MRGGDIVVTSYQQNTTLTVSIEPSSFPSSKNALTEDLRLNKKENLKKGIIELNTTARNLTDITIFYDLNINARTRNE